MQGTGGRRLGALPRLVMGSLALASVLLVTAGAQAVPAAPVLAGLPMAEGSAAPHATSAAVVSGGLSLGIQSSSPQICLNDSTSCSAGVGSSLVTLTARANASTWDGWSAVTIVFVLETTPYDGVYDPTAGEPGNDTCADQVPGSSDLCEESNGVPFFAENAGAIAEGIATAHPGTRFGFGLVAYSATNDPWDRGGGIDYEVEVGQPVPADGFGAAVQSSLVSLSLGGELYLLGSDLSQNILHSSSITALFGTLSGAGIAWANDTHHVVVWIGSTAPRDPNYPVNYCPSPSAYVPDGASCTPSNAANFTAPTCEPSYSFGGSVVSPACEAWVVGPNGSAQASIADLARTAPDCAGSLGGDCTIDTIDLYDSMTDSSSPSWPTREGGGPGGRYVQEDVDSILAAGCDLAKATGGTWDGPADASCEGFSGTLALVAHGPYNSPALTNPTLLSALTGVGLGTPDSNISAFAGSGSMFTFATWGNIAVNPGVAAIATCQTPAGSPGGCQESPTVVDVAGQRVLEWNWSTDPNTNSLAAGDNWSATVEVIAVGPPFETPVPVDACTTPACEANGSSSVGGFLTSANDTKPGSLAPSTFSYPLVRVVVVPDSPSQGGSTGPPPAPPGGHLPPVPVASPSPVTTPTPVPVSIASVLAAAGLSVQAAGAGLLAAGLTGVTVRRRTVAMKIASRSGVTPSVFDPKTRQESDRFVRHE